MVLCAHYVDTTMTLYTETRNADSMSLPRIGIFGLVGVRSRDARGLDAAHKVHVDHVGVADPPVDVVLRPQDEDLALSVSQLSQLDLST